MSERMNDNDSSYTYHDVSSAWG